MPKKRTQAKTLLDSGSEALLCGDAFTIFDNTKDKMQIPQALDDTKAETLDVINAGTIWKVEDSQDYIISFYGGCHAITPGQPE